MDEAKFRQNGLRASSKGARFAELRPLRNANFVVRNKTERIDAKQCILKEMEGSTFDNTIIIIIKSN